jgi:hypothetical protein
MAKNLKKMKRESTPEIQVKKMKIKKMKILKKAMK